MSERVLLEVTDRIATVTVNRPEKRNAMNEPTRKALRDRFTQATDDDDARVIVLRGAGDSYIAGGDIEAFTEFDQVSGLEYLDNYAQGLYNEVAEVPKPTIAAIDGYAFGGGLEISLACDLRVATADAKIGLPEVGLGIIPGGGGTQRLAHVAGAGVAKDLIFTGRSLDAEEALDRDVVNRVYDTEEFDERVKELAHTIAENAPLALRLAKESINRGLNAEAGLDFERIACAFLFGTEDKQEGAEAFLEDRNAFFKGR